MEWPPPESTPSSPTFPYPTVFRSRGRPPIGGETGMGEGVNGVQDRRDGRKKRLAGGGGAHRPDEPQPQRDPFKRFPMPCRDADGGMDQLMREDGRDLRRHGVRPVREVGPDEDFKMPVRAQPRSEEHTSEL